MFKYLFILFLPFMLLMADDMQIEDDFLESLNEVSEIATKTKLNIDDTPSFVTVLLSEELQEIGVNNIFEALVLVPGVQLKREASGVPVVIFRGVSQKGEVKLMIDGVTINNAYRGSIYHYLDFPIDLVKRIEVIRGAGSVLYGSNAISGVINIITKASQQYSKNNAFVLASTDKTYKGGALVSQNFNDIKFSLDTYYEKSNKTVSVGRNSSIYTGESDRHIKDFSVGMNINSEHFNFIARVKKIDSGNAYGILGILDTDKNDYNNINTSYITEFSYKNKLNLENKLNISVGYSRYEQDAEASHLFAPVLDAIYKEDSYNIQADIISSSITNNELLFGVKFETFRTLKSDWSALLPYISNPDFSRDITSVYLNDTYSVNENLDISAGLRYDYYNDIGNACSPTLGFVYRFNERVRIKGLYSHSFRAPSWIELTSNFDLNPETSDSFEMGIIFKQNQYICNTI